MRKLIREETTTVVKVYEADEDELALGGAAESVKVAEAGADVASVVPDAATPSAIVVPPEQHEDEADVHVKLEERDCYCPKPRARVRGR